jgi:hypothetical protein
VLATWAEGSAHVVLPAVGSILVGRAEDCDLIVSHGSVSRHHARLAVGPRLTIEDLGSSNGTRLRGQRLAQGVPAPIEEGVAIEIGDVTLLLRGAGAAATSPIDPPPVPIAPLAHDLAKLERERIIDALARCGGNQTRAAAMLGFSRRTLVSRMSEYDLPRPLKAPR